MKTSENNYIHSLLEPGEKLIAGKRSKELPTWVIINKDKQKYMDDFIAKHGENKWYKMEQEYNDWLKMKNEEEKREDDGDIDLPDYD